MAMTIEQLAKAVQALEVTDETIREMEERLQKANDQFELERQAREADPQGFLRRQYTI